MKQYDRLTCVVDGEARVMETKFESKWAMQKAVDRLAEIEEKIENGTLIELPCKVGDKVFYIHNNGLTIPRVEEFTLYGFSIDSKGIYLHIDYWEMISIDDAYFTKAEAEAKLKALRGE